MADSDCPAAVVGEERTYAYTGAGKFTPDTWFAAIKQGHTFVTNGPMLLLTVDKAMPGDEVQGRQEHKAAHPRAGLGAGIDWDPEGAGGGLARPGDPLPWRRATRKQGKLAVEFDLPAGESQWIAARTTAFNGAVAHTSPVYVIVDGASFMDRSQLPQLVAKRLKVLDFIEKQRLSNPNFTKNWAPGVVDQLRLRIQDARERYLAVAKTK